MPAMIGRALRPGVAKSKEKKRARENAGPKGGVQIDAGGAGRHD